MQLTSLAVIASGLVAFASATPIESPLSTVANAVTAPVDTLVQDVTNIVVDSATQPNQSSQPADSNQCIQRDRREIWMLRKAIDLYYEKVKDALVEKYGEVYDRVKVTRPPAPGYHSPYDDQPCQELHKLRVYYDRMKRSPYESSGETVFLDGKPFRLPAKKSPKALLQ
ncbi:hypothetical protein C0993_005741 [Termitomyces sp. T159_Od127]|nr:hypothetical protein C0993_005741 [Termitomyces sp. T159_Od127]